MKYFYKVGDSVVGKVKSNHGWKGIIRNVQLINNPLKNSRRDRRNSANEFSDSPEVFVSLLYHYIAILYPYF